MPQIIDCELPGGRRVPITARELVALARNVPAPTPPADRERVLAAIVERA